MPQAKDRIKWEERNSATPLSAEVNNRHYLPNSQSTTSDLLGNKTIYDTSYNSKSYAVNNSRYISKSPDDLNFGVKTENRWVVDKPNESYVNETLKQPSIPTTYESNIRKASKNHIKSHTIGHKSKEEIQMKNRFSEQKNKAPLKEFDSNYQGENSPKTIYDEARRFSALHAHTREVIPPEFLSSTLDKLSKGQLKSIRCKQCGVRVVEMQGSYCDSCQQGYL